MRCASLTPSITSKTSEVEIFLAAHPAQHGVHHAGGAVHIEAQLHQALDHALDLPLRGALLHDDDHLFLSIGFHPHALDHAHFVDDALEDAAHRLFGQRPAIADR
jgi:hypothetical protein